MTNKKNEWELPNDEQTAEGQILTLASLLGLSVVHPFLGIISVALMPAFLLGDHRRVAFEVYEQLQDMRVEDRQRYVANRALDELKSKYTFATTGRGKWKASAIAWWKERYSLDLSTNEGRQKAQEMLNEVRNFSRKD